MLKQLLLNTVI